MGQPWEEYTENYCWIASTYFVPASNQLKVAHPHVAPVSLPSENPAERTSRYLYYYQVCSYCTLSPPSLHLHPHLPLHILLTPLGCAWVVLGLRSRDSVPPTLRDGAQWVPIVLVLQCVLFLVPAHVGKLLSARMHVDIDSLLLCALDAHTAVGDQRERAIAYIARCIEDVLYRSLAPLTYSYIATL